MFGKFVVLEGIDRSGKTTVLSKVAKKVEREKAFRIEVARMEFPNRESLTGELVSRYLKKSVKLPPQAAHLLFSANRWEMADFIVENRKDKLLLCDRYFYSGIVYSHAKGMDLEWCRAADKGLPAPDAVYFIKVDPRDVVERSGFGNERYENTAFLEKVNEAYMKVLGNLPYCAFIDGSLGVEEIADDIFRRIALLFS